MSQNSIFITTVTNICEVITFLLRLANNTFLYFEFYYYTFISLKFLNKLLVNKEFEIKIKTLLSLRSGAYFTSIVWVLFLTSHILFRGITISIELHTVSSLDYQFELKMF